MKQLVLGKEPCQLLAGQLVSLLFFEPSSRTFGSFAAAVKRLGGQTLEIQNPETVSSVNKGETFEDTIRVFEAYSDAIVLRHPRPGAALRAAETPWFACRNACTDRPKRAITFGVSSVDPSSTTSTFLRMQTILFRR